MLYLVLRLRGDGGSTNMPEVLSLKLKRDECVDKNGKKLEGKVEEFMIKENDKKTVAVLYQFVLNNFNFDQVILKCEEV